MALTSNYRLLLHSTILNAERNAAGVAPASGGKPPSAGANARREPPVGALRMRLGRDRRQKTRRRERDSVRATDRIGSDWCGAARWPPDKELYATSAGGGGSRYHSCPRALDTREPRPSMNTERRTVNYTTRVRGHSRCERRAGRPMNSRAEQSRAHLRRTLNSELINELQLQQRALQLCVQYEYVQRAATYSRERRRASARVSPVQVVAAALRRRPQLLVTQAHVQLLVTRTREQVVVVCAQFVNARSNETKREVRGVRGHAAEHMFPEGGAHVQCSGLTFEPRSASVPRGARRSRLSRALGGAHSAPRISAREHSSARPLVRRKREPQEVSRFASAPLLLLCPQATRRYATRWFEQSRQDDSLSSRNGTERNDEPRV